jgi:DNA-binding MarR family transcriptional regulator
MSSPAILSFVGRHEFIEGAVGGWAKIFEDRDLTNLGLIQRVVWCGRLAEGLLDEVAQRAGIRRRGDYEVLALLRRSEPNQLAPQDVAESLLVSPSGMTGRIDRLEKQGLLERMPDTLDRRALRLGLTNLGRQTVDNTFRAYLDLYDRLLEPFTARQIKEVDGLLRVLLSELDEKRVEDQTE